LHLALAGQSIAPAAGVASALRSFAGANKHGICAAYRPSPHAGRAGVISRIKDLDPTRKQDCVYLSEDDVYRGPADEKLKLLARIMQRFDLCAVQGAVFG